MQREVSPERLLWVGRPEGQPRGQPPTISRDSCWSSTWPTSGERTPRDAVNPSPPFCGLSKAGQAQGQARDRPRKSRQEHFRLVSAVREIVQNSCSSRFRKQPTGRVRERADVHVAEHLVALVVGHRLPRLSGTAFSIADRSSHSPSAVSLTDCCLITVSSLTRP